MDLTRRQFTRLGAAAAGGVLFSSRARADQTPVGSPRLGYSLYGMKALPIPEALRAVRQIGYGNVEFCLNRGFPAEPVSFSGTARREAKRTVAEQGLTVSSYMADMQLFGRLANPAANLESIRRSAEVAHEVSPGADAPIETVLGGKPEDWEKEKDRAAERLHAWGEAADRSGINLAVKGHAGGAVRLPTQLKWLLEKADHPRLVVNFDQSHYQLEQVPLAASIAALRPWIRIAHVKDSTGSATDFHFLAAGEGRTDFAAYFKALREAGFSGPLIVEISSQIFQRPGYDAVALAERTYRTLLPAVLAT